MGNKRFVVEPTRDVESSPEVTADDNTSETEVTDLRDIIKIDATHSIDATVDESASCCVCEFGQR